MFSILIVDDESSVVDVISEMLGEKEYIIHKSTEGKKAIEIIKSQKIDLILCDMKMFPINGFKVLQESLKIKPDVPFILMTAYGSIQDAVKCMRLGAYDYITKPVKMRELRVLVRRAIDQGRLVKTSFSQRKEQDPNLFANLIGNSEPMQFVYNVMDKVARTDSTVLVYGESGTGKELVARAIHYHSPRKEKPFVTVNCGGLPETLLETELFGHVKGSFTGAIHDKEGLFQVANGGTIFLDEISATGSSIQVKLLRVLQEREIKRVGDTKNIPVDVRVVAATNKKLEDEVRVGEFREDLYYRLSVIPIQLPPLRERKDDIPILVKHLLQKHKGNRELKSISNDIIELLTCYNWPGNVRELENVIIHAIALADTNEISVSDLPPGVINTDQEEEGMSGQNLKDVMRQREKEYINKIIKQVNGDKKKAAQVLSIDLATLYRKLQ